MRKFTYEELYGVTLNEYYDYLDKRIDTTRGSRTILPSKTIADIELLQSNYNRYAQRNHELDDRELQLASAIKKLIKKKERHLKRQLSWRKEK